MTRFIDISPRARAEIDGIWHYTLHEHGQAAADRYIDRLDQSMELALEFPEIGADYREVRAGYRMLPSGHHLIFYIPRDDGIDVLRVLHERMDIRSRLMD